MRTVLIVGGCTIAVAAAGYAAFVAAMYVLASSGRRPHVSEYFRQEP